MAPTLKVTIAVKGLDPGTRPPPRPRLRCRCGNDRTYASFSTLRNHVRTGINHPRWHISLNYRCSHCTRAFPSLREASTHIRLSHDFHTSAEIETSTLLLLSPPPPTNPPFYQTRDREQIGPSGDYRYRLPHTPTSTKEKAPHQISEPHPRNCPPPPIIQTTPEQTGPFPDLPKGTSPQNTGPHS